MQADLLRIGDIVVEELEIPTLTDGQIDELTDFENVFGAESAPDDPPAPYEVGRIGHRTMPDFVVLRSFVAREGTGAIVANASASWVRAEDNQHILNTWIGVLPSLRRKRLATGLLRLVVDAADEAGKRLLMFRTTDRVPAGEAFARAIGAEVGLLGHTNRLILADVDRAMIERWVDDGPGRAPGYTVLAIDGRYPDDIVDEVVDLWGVMNTAPRDHLDMEDQITTVEQVREAERGFFAMGAERWLLLAREDATGAHVGWTEVAWFPHEPDTVWQFGTGVRPQHRGHALGKWMKAAMLARIFDERPGVRDIRTHNADSNDPMLSINHQLGFKPYRTDINWQVDVGVAREYLA